MPRRKKKSEESEEEESEWEEKSQSSSDDDDDDEDSDHVVAESASEEEETPPDDEDDEDFEQVPKKKKKKKAPAPSKPRKRKQPAFFAEASDDEDEAALLPTHVRKTARGGYAHTNKSKSKISKANRGNTPWNKGKNRSAAVKAKISAGVRARNKVRLLKKLRKLGMTEDEYNAKQKQIKFLRERVRVTKMKKSWGRPGVKKRPADDSSDDEEEESSQAAEEKEEGMEALEEDQAPEQVASTEQKKSGDDANEKDSQPTEAAAGPIPSTIFAKEIEFSSHAFDADEDGAYKKICPTGGPGGLICCETCMQNYSQYMSQTAQDIESCRIENARKEVTDLLGFVRDTRVAMQKNMRLARRQPPPAVPASFKSSKLGRKGGGSSGAPAASFPEWNATSSIDIGALGASASV